MRKINLIVILIAFVCAQSYSQLNIEPVAYYKLDGNAKEEISGANGTIHGQITETPDRNGNPCGAMEFDGSSYIEGPASSALNGITSEFTITGWINFSSSCGNNLFWATILCKGDKSGETDSSPQFRLQFTKVTFSIKSNMIDSKGCVPWDMESTFSYDTWHFFATTYDGSTAKMFLDGKEIFSYKLNQILESNSSPLHIGRDAPGADEYFCGKLDDIKIFNQALSAQDIKTIFNHTPQTNCISTCNFPQTIDNINIEYHWREYRTDKEKIMIFAFDDINIDDEILINFNGTWHNRPIQLSDNRQVIYEGYLTKKCNYIIFRGVKSNIVNVYNVGVDRENFGNIETEDDKYFGIKIIYEE